MRNKKGAFKAMVGAVFTLFIGMIIFSILAPEFSKVNRQIADEDPTGTSSKVLDATESIPDPKGIVKETGGGFLLNLLENHPDAFLILVLITAGVLTYFGITAGQVRAF